MLALYSCIYSNAECARRAGYAKESANVHASRLLNGKDYPLVTQHITELREEREKKYGVTLIVSFKDYQNFLDQPKKKDNSLPPSMLKRLDHLGGLTVDRREKPAHTFY